MAAMKLGHPLRILNLIDGASVWHVHPYTNPSIQCHSYPKTQSFEFANVLETFF